jgi:hypothetical protein
LLTDTLEAWLDWEDWLGSLIATRVLALILHEQLENATWVEELDWEVELWEVLLLWELEEEYCCRMLWAETDLALLKSTPTRMKYMPLELLDWLDWLEDCWTEVEDCWLEDWEVDEHSMKDQIEVFWTETEVELELEDCCTWVDWEEEKDWLLELPNW